MNPTLPDIRSLSLEELQSELKAWNQPSYRATQLSEWLYPRRATDWSVMSNLPRLLRQHLQTHFSLSPLALVTLQGAPDTTRKFLWRLPDGALIESVLIPANPALYGEASDRHTLCLSTQVGCAFNCAFCASGLNGFSRNLTPAEIVDQVLATERWFHPTQAPPTTSSPPPPPDRCIDNLVVMGMGEPLANYENLLKALRILNAPWGAGIGARKITVSTSGLCPQIRRLADEPHQFRLAISLHAPTDDLRNRLMPVNRKYPLPELIAACEFYQARKGRMITFEYILIAGLNDHPNLAPQLADLARRVHAKVNLIPYNQVEGLEWTRPTPDAQETFLAALESRGISATLRREKGHDIDAACGQLRLKTPATAFPLDPVDGGNVDG